MDETLFYVAGIALILVALGISAIGMRSDDFPSTGVLRAGVALTAAVVVVTAFGAVTLSEAEQEERETEETAALAEEELAAENEESGAAEPETPEGSGQGPTDAGPEPTEENGQAPNDAGGPPEVIDDAGSAVFVENGCGSCHTLTDLGDDALGQIGPNLDEALVDEDAAFIETSIVDPSANVEEGFSDGIMPGDYAAQIAPADLTALVGYLSQATSGGGGSSSGSGKKK